MLYRQQSHSRREFMSRLIETGALMSATRFTGQAADHSTLARTLGIESGRSILYFNDDSNALLYSAYPLQPKALATYVETYARHGVDVFSWDVLVNGVCFYATTVGPGICQGLSQYLDLEAVVLAQNIQNLASQGANPPALVADVCHRSGMLMMAGFRMGLGIFGPELLVDHGVFYNPKALKFKDSVVKALPRRSRWYDGWADHNLIAVLDWSNPEVHDLVLAPIREVVNEFDVDGIELSFQGCIFFDADQAPRKAPIMTGFVRKVRQTLDDVAQKKGGKRLLLGVRHFGDPDVCLNFGLDVGEWIKQGLVDIDMPSQDNDGGIDFNSPIESFVAFCKDSKCLVLPTIIPGTGDFRYNQYADFDRRVYTLPQLRAVVESWYNRGALGISTYNYQHRRSDSVTWEESIGWLQELSDPSLVRKNERAWPLFGVSLSFKSSEVGLRKTISAPRYAVVPNLTGTPPPVLRFQALQLAPDDILEIDVDGVRVPNLQKVFTVSRVHQGWITGGFTQPREGDSHLYPAFTVEASLPKLRPSGQIGFRLVKRHLPNEIQISEMEIVTLAHSRVRA